MIKAKIILSVLSILTLFKSAIAQVPRNLPTDTEPVEFSDKPYTIVIYIVVPILAVGFYYWWRKVYQKKKDE